jgi:guanosine-3',5'-bis(diphosphate) 3'-pyrophosphohydrolase
MSDFTNYWNALTFAVERYGNLKRKLSKLPYIIHPIRVATILRATGYSEYEHEELMIATIFHDLVEDTATKLEEIEDLFGSKVALIVKEVSKPNDKSKDEWLKNFGNFSSEAKILKMADRIDNLIDMEGWSKDQQRYYSKQAKIILEQCGKENKYLANKMDEIISYYLEKE